MNPIDFAVRKPITVLVGVIMVVMFGLITATRLPIQLTPNVDKPVVTVTTRWEGASPEEIEREIVNEQEEKLKGIEGLEKMTSTATEGQSSVELEFGVGLDIDRVLVDVSDKLRQVAEYPENVDEPVMQAGDREEASAIAWFILRPTADSKLADGDIPLLYTMIEEDVKPLLERAEGISRIGVVGGVEREVHVEVNPAALAGRQLSLLDVRDAIRSHNVDVSAGTIEQGKRAYTIRTVGEFENLSEIENLLLARRDGNPVYLRDVGRVTLGYKKKSTIVRTLGRPAIAINAGRQAGTNVIEVMKNLQAAVAEANRDLLAPHGLRLEQAFDQTVYIYRAIDLVVQNLWVGGVLAVLVMLLFLRELRSTLIVATAIPISVIGSFMALGLMGRNLNVISLAGLAFAVGMVVDNSIVVLENIFRHRQEGKSAWDAAVVGAKEVWGAVLASTLTTLAVFVPVLFVQEEAGQLFRDIAIAISAAVLLSLAVSVLFIPMVASRLGNGDRDDDRGADDRGTGDRGTGPGAPAPRRRRFGLAAFGSAFGSFVANIVDWLNHGILRRLATVLGLTGIAVALTIVFVPPMSYLPAGNQNLIFAFVLPPPGYSTDEFVRMGEMIEERLAPYWQEGDLPAELQRPPWYRGKDPIPKLGSFFYVAFGQSVFMGGRSVDEENVAPLVELFRHAAADVPGVFAFPVQSSLFERGLTSGNSIDLEISGSDMDLVKATTGALTGSILENLGTFPRPDPSNYNLGAPEIRLKLDEAAAADLDLNVRDLGFIVRCMIDGAVVSDFRYEGATIDIKLRPVLEGRRYTEQLSGIPLFTPAGRYVPLSAVADLEEGTAPTEIRHIEERRAVKLIVSPPDGEELSKTMRRLQEEVIAPLRAAGAIPPSVMTRMSGTADKLVATRDALLWNFVLAIVITYLLLSALFESFLYPIVILFSVPLAAVGGILGLRIAHELTGHQMDLLTMLGFVILVGTVVNNAILIVHQGLRNMREGGMVSREAIRQSVRTRVRPIFMSTSTSILGMIPLVLFPGAGSELYRGLGSVVIGGLAASTVFTLLVVPTLFSLVIAARERLFGRIRDDARHDRSAAGAAMPG